MKRKILLLSLAAIFTAIWIMMFAGCEKTPTERPVEQVRKTPEIQKPRHRGQLIVNLTDLMNLNAYAITPELRRWSSQNKVPFHFGKTLHGKTDTIMHHPLPPGLSNTITFNNILISPRARLRFSTGIFSNNRADFASDGATFVVAVRQGDETREVYRDTVLKFDTWKDAIIDLSQYANQKVAIELRTEPYKTFNYDWALWGSPRLVSQPSLAFSSKNFDTALRKRLSGKTFNRNLPAAEGESWVERGWPADAIVTEITLPGGMLPDVIRNEIFVLERMNTDSEPVMVEYLDETDTVLESAQLQITEDHQILNSEYHLDNSNKAPAKIRVTLHKDNPSVVFLKEPVFYSTRDVNKKEEKPNVILISLDTLRADRLGCYGYSRDTSPNLDAFATEGFRFVNSYSNATWTLPSHASMFTSLYPSRHRIVLKSWRQNRFREIDLEHRFITQIFQDQRYLTTAFTGGGFVGSEYGFNKGFDYHVEDVRELTREGLETMTGMIKTHPSVPFFLFFHTYAPHDYFKNQAVYQKYVKTTFKKDMEPEQFFRSIILLSKSPGFRKTLDYLLSGEDAQYLSDLYDGGIAHTDDFLGQLFRELKTMGVYDTSWIIVTSDHGEGFGNMHDDSETTTWGHGRHLPYQEQTHVPLIIKPPGHLMSTLSGPRIIEDPVQTIDIPPTLCGLIGIVPPGEFQGKNLLPMMAGQQEKDRQVEKSETRVFIEDMNKRYFSVIENNTKLMMGLLPPPQDWMVNMHEYRYELYDLAADPGEQNNLAGSAESIPAIKEMRRQIREHLGDMPDTPCSEEVIPEDTPVFDPNMDMEQMRRLKELGYL